MRRRAILLGLVGAIVGAASPPVGAQRASEQKVVGPALVCGEAFALRLRRGETMVRRDPGIDFLLYYVKALDGPFLLYEGNYAQPHDDEIKTSLSFPSVIAIHDNRGAAAKARSRIRDRLLTGSRSAALCPQQRSGR
ncbi:MAG: hypothetical protein QOG84_1416 [Sphingomonadales bacterium]|jgi:hypothetical protein|nr:hypothetical protein [Sphingomonadales bacterium]